jgi:hypothetical protein
MSGARHKWWWWLADCILSATVVFLAQLYFGACYDGEALTVMFASECAVIHEARFRRMPGLNGMAK